MLLVSSWTDTVQEIAHLTLYLSTCPAGGLHVRNTDVSGCSDVTTCFGIPGTGDGKFARTYMRLKVCILFLISNSLLTSKYKHWRTYNVF